MKISKILFSVCVCFYLPLQSNAWGVLGHRIIGQIADSYLTAKARAEIKKILGDTTVAIASNWADFIKSDTNYRYLSPWHYIDLEKGMDYAQLKDFLKKDTAVDAYTKLNFIIAQLKNKKANLDIETKKMYLRLLIHIVGDIHQPLHTIGAAKGGNDIKVNWMSESTNLHSIWDSKLIDFQQLSYTEYTNVINHTTAAQRKQWQSEPISKMIFDTYTIAQQVIDQAESQYKPNTRLGFQYDFQYIAIVNQQLLKGGVHLAGILNDIFGK